MLLHCPFISAQENGNIEIKGIVIDAKTGEPLPFAHIVIKNRPVGTVTDESGIFSFLFDSVYFNDTLIISYISYKQYSGNISGLLEGINEICLEPSAVEIKEITISQADAAGIVRKSVGRIPGNYWREPVVMRGFYRETISENNLYTEYAEGVIDIYKYPYRSASDDQVKLIKGRRKNDLNPYRISKKAVVTLGGPVFCNYYDRIRYPLSFLDTLRMDQYDYELETMVNYNNNIVYVISFDQVDGLRQSLRKGRLYIDPDTYVILRIEYGYSEKGIKYELPHGAAKRFLKLLAGIVIEDDILRVSVDYQEVNGYWCLKNILYQEEQVIIRKKERFIIAIQKNLLINNVSEGEVSPFTVEEILTSKEFNKQIGDYDEAFWYGYNYLSAPESMLEVIVNMEKE